MEQAEPKQSPVQKLREFAMESRRVLRVTKKPDQQEFSTIVKISGLGIILIGLIGFLTTLVGTLVFSL